MIIYKATNITNGKFYIGKTARSLDIRRDEHIDGAPTGTNTFSKAIRKYGKDKFSWEILDSFATSEKELSQLEIKYIAQYGRSYNETDGGEGCIDSTGEIGRKISKARKGQPAPNKGKPMSAEQKVKISLSQKGKSRGKGRKQSAAHRAKTSKNLMGNTLNVGKKRSAESKKNISLGHIGIKMTEEGKRNLSLALKGKKKPPRTEEHINNLKVSLAATRLRKKKERENANQTYSNFRCPPIFKEFRCSDGNINTSIKVSKGPQGPSFYLWRP
jgi:hypothetical protein